MKIDVSKITDRQVMEMKVGLLQYQYIQDHFKLGDNEDFRDVFNNFYLKSQSKMTRPENRNPFFEKLFACPKNEDLVHLVEYLYDSLATDMYEFSFATKLLHTVNTDSPIYDSKVYKYLKNEEGVDFWDIQQNKKDPNGRPLEKIEKIRHNWEALNNWYRHFTGTTRFKEWIIAFDKCQPEFKTISNIKKIDFIIFTCSGY